MRATDFEFRYRFFLIGICFWLPFFLYAFDKQNAAAALANLIAVKTGISGDKIVHAIFILAALFTVLAASLRTWASSYLQSHIVHDLALHSENLVADGPYRFVRNPLYCGNLLLALAVGTMANREGFFLIVIANFIVVLRLILREEKQLSETQGASYQKYLRAVPRLLPSLTPRVPASGAQPRWTQAFFGETFFWGFAVASIGFALTLNFKFWYIPMLVSLPLYWVTAIVLKWQHRASSAGNGNL